jgi:cholesterol oxidase
VTDFDFDWLVIGSGFGGSVSALRLSEKGFRVGVLECGRRFRDDELPKSAWDFRRFFWAPKLGMKGIWRLTPFKDVFILSGSGVGGGSLAYACTLYRADDKFYQNSQWAELGDWKKTLDRHYDTAERMLGVVPIEFEDDKDRLLREVAAHLGCEETFQHTRVGIHFGEAGKQVPDPYFGGEGPDRTGCKLCGACMLGCRHGAKNTLVKNYLWLAEKKGACILPERTVTEIRPLGAADGSDGYLVTSEKTGALLRRDRRQHKARGVVVAAGALGTNALLANCKQRGALPSLSRRLGELVRTNSETLLAVTFPDDRHDFTKSVTITSSIFPDPSTHVELATFGPDSSAMGLLFTLLTRPGTRLTRPMIALGTIIRHPIRFLKTLSVFRWSRRTVVVGIMQSLDNAIRFRTRRRWLGRGVRLTTEQDPEHPIPTHFPIADQIAEWIAQKVGGVSQAMIFESFFNIPTTAHILGGCVIGKDASRGVVNDRCEVFNYQNLLVCDGAVVPANPAVNPSLTITALAEHAMESIPGREE